MNDYNNSVFTTTRATTGRNRCLNVFLKDRIVTCTARATLLIAGGVHPHCYAIWALLPLATEGSGLSIEEVTSILGAKPPYGERYIAEVLARMVRAGYVQSKPPEDPLFSKSITSSAAFRSRVTIRERELCFVPRSGRLAFVIPASPEGMPILSEVLPDEESINQEEFLIQKIRDRCLTEPRLFSQFELRNDENAGDEGLERSFLMAKKTKVVDCEVHAIKVTSQFIIHKCSLSVDRNNEFCSAEVYSTDPKNFRRLRREDGYANYITRCTRKDPEFIKSLIHDI